LDKFKYLSQLQRILKRETNEERLQPLHNQKMVDGFTKKYKVHMLELKLPHFSGRKEAD